MIGGLFDIKYWGDWAVRSLLVLGLATFIMFVMMQVQPMEVEINLPTIQHTFKK